MRQSADLNRIYWFFLSIFIALIYIAIIVWADTPIHYKVLAGGIFALIDTGLFWLLRDSQIAKEEAETQVVARELGLPYVKELPDGSKVHMDPALPAPVENKQRYYCSHCGEVRTEDQVWGDRKNKLCRVCDNTTMRMISDTVVVCAKCGIPNNLLQHTSCWKCGTILPKLSKDKTLATSDTSLTSKGE